MYLKNETQQEYLIIKHKRTRCTIKINKQFDRPKE